LLSPTPEDDMNGSFQSLIRDDRLLEGLRSLVDRYVGEQSSDAAVEALSSLAARLKARIAFEEGHLFPRIEQRVDDPRFALTSRMRRQHAVLLELLEGIEEAVRRDNFAAAAGDLRELQAALHAHLEEERRVLLPILGPSGGGTA
jgi:hypothetical protein